MSEQKEQQKDTNNFLNILNPVERNESFTKKTALKNIILSDKYNNVYGTINDIANKINKLVIHTYHFLKCWILKNYENNQEIPEIDLELFELIFKVLIDNTDVRKVNIKKDKEDTFQIKRAEREAKKEEQRARKKNKRVVKTNFGVPISDVDKENNTMIDDKEQKEIIKQKINKGKKLTGSKLNLYDKLTEFYETEYKPLTSENKVNIINSQQLLTYVARDMLTNVKNNIKLNFFRYIRRFVNCNFKINEVDATTVTENGENIPLTKAQIYAQNKELRKELYLVRLDLINDTLKSDEKYHDWIKNIRPQILPSNYVKSHEHYLDTNPQKYLKHMIFINVQLENLKCKMYQVFPLRSNSVTKYIPIDTKIIIQHLIFENRKDKYLNNISECANEVWRNFFKMDNKLFRKKGYKFNNLIYTDGIGVSISFVNDELCEKNKIKIKNMQSKKVANKNEYNGKTDEEKKLYKEEKERIKKLEEDKVKLERYNEKIRFKEENKKKRLEEQKLKKQENKILSKNKVCHKNEKLTQKDETIIVNVEKIDKTKDLKKEFLYLDDLKESQVEKLKTSNLVYVDPGKIRLYTMINNKGEVLKYSNREYMKRINKDKNYKKLKKLREKLNIIKGEETLASHISKSCKLDTFKNYVKEKNKINVMLAEEYRNEIFRKYKWYSYIMKQKEIDRLIYIIKEKYGKDCKLIMGDWSPSMQMKNFVPTPMIGLKRALRKKIEIINLDEFNTSKLNYLTEEKCENIKLPVRVAKKDENHKFIRDKNNKIIKELTEKYIHSILTYQVVKELNGYKISRKGCINRDINSVKNMRKIVNYWFEHKDRPLAYCRGKQEITENQLSTVEVTPKRDKNSGSAKKRVKSEKVIKKVSSNVSPKKRLTTRVTNPEVKSQVSNRSQAII